MEGKSSGNLRWASGLGVEMDWGAFWDDALLKIRHVTVRLSSGPRKLNSTSSALLIFLQLVHEVGDPIKYCFREISVG